MYSKIETETEFYRNIKYLDDAVRDGLCEKNQKFHMIWYSQKVNI